MIKHVDENGIVYNVIDIRRSDGQGGYISVNKIIHDNQEIIVKQESINGDYSEPLRIWVDDFTSYDSGLEGIADENGYSDTNEFLQDLAAGNFREFLGANPYICYGETLKYNGTTYYVWEYDEDQNNPVNQGYYLLTTTADYNTLYNISLESDITNNTCPYVFMLSHDSDMEYESSNREDVLIRVEYV